MGGVSGEAPGAQGSSSWGVKGPFGQQHLGNAGPTCAFRGFTQAWGSLLRDKRRGISHLWMEGPWQGGVPRRPASIPPEPLSTALEFASATGWPHVAGPRILVQEELDWSGPPKSDCPWGCFSWPMRWWPEKASVPQMLHLPPKAGAPGSHNSSWKLSVSWQSPQEGPEIVWGEGEYGLYLAHN